MEITLFKGRLIVVTRSLTTRANIYSAFPCFIYLHIDWRTLVEENKLLS